MTARTKHAITLTGFFGLLCLWVAWATVLAPPRHAPTSLVLTASTLPLLMWLRGLLHERRGAYLGLGLFSLAYFIHGIGALTNRAELHLALPEVALSLLLFGGCLLCLKRRADD